MNAPLRRVGIVVVILFGLLFANLNLIQVYQAESYLTNKYNGRVPLAEYQRPRGAVELAGGVVAAQSVVTTDELKYLRQYPLGAAYAPVVGYRPVNLAATGIEWAEDSYLSGSSGNDRLRELLTGQTGNGDNVLLTINRAVQDKAYSDLLHNPAGAKVGAAVVIDPSTGAILALASTPSYDPNKLVNHDTDSALAYFNTLDADPNKPLLNRATQETFPPGSTMKVIISAAALSTGQYSPQTVIPAGPSYTPVAGGGFTIHNADPGICPDPTITLILALTESCNTGFAQLGVTLGGQRIIDMARGFGFGDSGLTLAGTGDRAMTVAPSQTGDMTGTNGQDDPNAVAQSSIGQLNVRMTPLQEAMIAATVANNGVQMRPYLVDKIQSADLTTTVYQASPTALRQPISAGVAADLQQMMISVVDHGTGRRAQISGFQVGGKTGTAQNATDTGDHGWFIGFVMKDNQPIAAVAVFLEHAGAGGSADAADIAGDLMQTVITQRGLK